MSVEADPVSMFVEYIRRVRGSLFHVTDQSHLNSVEKHGLLSKIQRDRLGIDPAYPGGNALTAALDEDYGLSKYVFLGFTESSVMPAHKDQSRVRRPVLLRVDAAILSQFGVRIALGRANHAATSHYSVKYALQKIEPNLFHRVLTGTYDWSDFKMRPKLSRIFDYEVLVPDSVPVEYLSG